MPTQLSSSPVARDLAKYTGIYRGGRGHSTSQDPSSEIAFSIEADRTGWIVDSRPGFSICSSSGAARLNRQNSQDISDQFEEWTIIGKIESVQDLIVCIHFVLATIHTVLVGDNSRFVSEPVTFASGVIAPEVIAEFVTVCAEDDSLKIRKLEYYGDQLYLYLMPLATPYHDVGLAVLSDLKNAMLRDRWVPWNWVSMLDVNQQTFYFGSTPNQMQPDSCLDIESHDGSRWPSLVIEVGNSQSYDELLDKKDRWFSASRGSVGVVLVLKFTSRTPLDDNSCFMQVWRSFKVDPSSGSYDHESVSSIQWPSIDTSERTRRIEEAIDDRIPGQSIVSYQEGPTYWVYPRNAAMWPDIPLTFQDYFGSGTESPAGRVKTDLFLFPLDLIRDKIDKQMRAYRRRLLSAENDNRAPEPVRRLTGERRRTPQPEETAVTDSLSTQAACHELASVAKASLATDVDTEIANLEMLIEQLRAQKAARADSSTSL